MKKKMISSAILMKCRAGIKLKFGFFAALFFISCTGARLPDEPITDIQDVSETEPKRHRALIMAAGLASDPESGALDIALSGWLEWIYANDANTARKRFERSLEIDPDTALARFGLARIAWTEMDYNALARHSLAVIVKSPHDPLAIAALFELEKILGLDRKLDAHIASRLKKLDDNSLPKLAILVRRTLANLYESRGEDEKYLDKVRLGTPSEWTVAGPFSRFSVLDEEDLSKITESGVIEERYDGPFGEIVPWLEPSYEGRLELLRSERAGDIYFAAVDLDVPGAGIYLLEWETSHDLLVVLSGKEVLRRDTVNSRPPEAGIEAVFLEEGRHRLTVRMLRDNRGRALRIALHDKSGNDSGINFYPAAGEPSATWPKEEEYPPEKPGFVDRTKNLLSKLSRRKKDSPDESISAAPGFGADFTELMSGYPLWSGKEELPKKRFSDICPSALKVCSPDNPKPANDDYRCALYYYLSSLYLMQSHTECAKQIISPLPGAAPDFTDAHYLSGLIAWRDQSLPSEIRIGRAGAAMRRAVESDPDHAPSRLLGSWIAIEQGRYDEAGKYLDEVYAMDSHSPFLVNYRADLYSARGLHVLSREVLEAGYAAWPNNCRLSGRVFSVRRNDHDFGAAEEAAPSLLNCGLEERITWAEYQASVGNEEEAIESLQKWIKIRPASYQAQIELVRMLILAARFNDAGNQLASMLEIRPYSSDLLIRKADIRARLGDDSRAGELRKKSLGINPNSMRVRRSLEYGKGAGLLDWAALDPEEKIKEYLADSGRREWGADAVLVLDHAGAEVFLDDPHRPVVVERVQTVTEILTRQGLDTHGEVSLPRGAIKISLYNRKRDGRIFYPETHLHKDTVTMEGLEVGDFIVSDYLLPAPARSSMHGWSAGTFYVQVFGLPIHELSYVARAPVSAGMEVESRNIRVDAPVEEDGMLVFRHSSSDIPALLPEHDSPGANELLPWFRVGAGAGPEIYGKIWGDYVSTLTRPDYEVRQFYKSVIANLSDDIRSNTRKLIIAIVNAVNDSVSGRNPSTDFSDTASHAIARGRGNRMIATKALLSAAGIESRIALIRPFDSCPEERRFPAGDIFRYAVLRVDPKDGGDYMWVDQNIRTAPIGTLRPFHSNQPAIIFAERGKPTEIVISPDISRDQESRRSELELVLDENGNLRGNGVDVYTGFWAAMVRSGTEQADYERRRQAVEASLAQAFGPVRLRELSFEGADDAVSGMPMVVNYTFEVEGWARIGDGYMEVPGGNLFPALISRRLARLSERKLPLLLQSEAVRILNARIVLPEAYVFDGKDRNISLESLAGTYSLELEAEGSKLNLNERLEMNLVRIAPEDYPEFTGFAAAVDGIQAGGFKFIRKESEQADKISKAMNEGG